MIGLVRAGEGFERPQVADPLLAVGDAREDRAEEAVADPLPVGPDRDDEVAAAPDPLGQGLPPEGVQGRHDLVVVGVQDHGLDRVIAVPAAGQEAPARVQPGDRDHVAARGRIGEVAEVGEARDHLDPLRLAQRGQQDLLGTELREPRPIRGDDLVSPPTARLVVQPQGEVGVVRPGTGVRRDPLALPRADVHRLAERRRRAVVVGHDHLQGPGEPLGAPAELDPDGRPGPQLVGVVLAQADPHVLHRDPLRGAADAVPTTTLAQTQSVAHGRHPRQSGMTRVP